MKKIILLAFILLAIPAIVLEETLGYSNGFSDLKKDEDWEKLKETLFRNYRSNMLMNRYEGPILIGLYDATSQDSTVVNSAMQSLKTLLPNKTIDYFENYTGESLDKPENDKSRIFKGYNFEYLKLLTIRIHFKDSLEINKNLIPKKEVENSIDREYTYIHGVQNSLNLSGFLKPIISISFNKDSSIDKRKRIVEFGLIKVLACKNEFLGMLDMAEISIESEERQDELRFLIKKLYTPSIAKDFENYMYKTYPWRYASNLLSAEKTKAIAVWICISLGIILCFLGFGLLYKKEFKYKYLAYFLPVLFFVISAEYIQALYKYISNSHFIQTPRIFILTLFLTALIAGFIALFLMLFDKFAIRKNMDFTLQLVFKTGFTFLICIASILISERIVNVLLSGLVSVNSVLLIIFIFAFGRGVLLYLDHFSENLVKQKDIELSQLREVNAQAQVKLLQSQINPHFLYNALNSIAGLAQTNGVKTEKMALSLSDLFKYTINRQGKKRSTIGDEVNMVKNYLEVEQIRFGDRLNFSIEVDESLYNLQIPMFLIQPLVENAIKHGISKIENDGFVHLKILKKVHDLVIKVMDNGPDFPDGLVSGHGLQTVHDLLQLSYGNNANINTQNHPEKAITITIKNIA